MSSGVARALGSCSSQGREKETEPMKSDLSWSSSFVHQFTADQYLLVIVLCHFYMLDI